MNGISSPNRVWAQLEPAWKESIDLAWHTFLSGDIAIGSALVDGTGAIVGTGQNRRQAT
jgi:tRNA(Arg) A34 adenosine deaminase TadA